MSETPWKGTLRVERRNITSSPDICGGRPCIEGTRIAAEAINNFWQDGYSVAQILEEYPTLAADDVVVAVSANSGGEGGRVEARELRAKCIAGRACGLLNEDITAALKAERAVGAALERDGILEHLQNLGMADAFNAIVHRAMKDTPHA